MSAVQAVSVGRRAARGIVIDDEGRLVLIKRAKPGQDPYWTSPGGGVEDCDATAGVAIQHFFLARLTSLNLAERYGPEFARPERGGYDLDYVPLRDDSLDAIDLKPTVLKEFVLANRDALLAEAGFGA
jgi:hypothetical protein